MTVPRPVVSLRETSVVGSQPVCTTDELPGPGEAIRVVVGEYEIGIFNVDGVWRAVDDYCTHERSSLSEEGWAEGDVVECSWHGARFNLCHRRGRLPTSNRATSDVHRLHRGQ